MNAEDSRQAWVKMMDNMPKAKHKPKTGANSSGASGGNVIMHQNSSGHGYQPLDATHISNQVDARLNNSIGDAKFVYKRGSHLGGSPSERSHIRKK